MARNAIESEFRISNMADRSEMARNAIESDFRTSKMTAEKKVCIYLKWQELLSKVNFRHPNGRSIWNGQKCNQKWFSNIQNVRRRPFCTQFKKNIVEYRSEMARNSIESDISDIQNSRRRPFCQKFKQKSVLI